MKFLLAIMLTALCTYAATLFLPWWAYLPGCYLVFALFPVSRAWMAFTASFSGVLLLYLCWLLWINTSNEWLLAGKVARIFGLSSGGQLMGASLLLYTVLGGLSGLAGFWLRRGIEYKQASV